MNKLVLPITHIAPLVPHSRGMILIDKVTAFGDNFLIAESKIRPDNLLIKQGEFSTFSGIEIMAQGVAVWAGCMAVEANESVKIGYLLGCRKLHLYSQHIPIGTTLQVRVTLSLQDSTGFGVFDCQLVDLERETILLQGALNVFSPRDKS